MSTPTSREFMSPFNYISQLVPGSDSKAFRYALYNALAVALFALFAFATVSVYYIFQAFVRPLIWALIIGSCLHPLKNSLTSLLKRWFSTLNASEQPLFAALLLFPLSSINALLNYFYYKIAFYIKPICIFIFILFSLYLSYYFTPIKSFFYVSLQGLSHLSNFLSFFTTKWMFLGIILYISIVFLYWTPESKRVLQILALPVWAGTVIHLSSLTGIFRVPLFLSLVVLLILGFVIEIRDSPNLFRAALGRVLSTDKQDNDSENKKDAASEARGDEIPSAASTTTTSAPASKGFVFSSNVIFLSLVWAHGLLFCFRQLSFTLNVFPVLLLFFVVKLLLQSIGKSDFVSSLFCAAWKKARDAFLARQEALAPLPVRGIFKLLMRGDRALRQGLVACTDTLVSVFVIVLVLSVSVFLVVFLAIQIQRESIELMSMTSRVLNNTVTTASSNLLPETKNLQKMMDSAVGNVYVFGRQWISGKIRTVFDTTDDYNKAKIEEQVLQLWDRLYEKLAAKNITWDPVWQSLGHANVTLERPRLSRQTSMSMWNTAAVILDTSNLLDFVKENLGVVTSVLESLWVLLKGNLNLCVTVLTTVLSIIFGGGTAVLNFLLSSLVFLTSLYLLLCFSGDLYLPVQFVMSLSPTQPSGAMRAFYSAVEDAISGVFLASLKIAIFYGLYTNLTHTVFGVNLVFVPSVLAAVFGAVPFLGTYWAALPGVIELWLIHDRALLAILLLVVHFIPTYVVDTVIYGEIKGAGHPYLTGLAVAGGLYWFGLEGAIFGPILLACLLVAVNVYSLAIAPYGSDSGIVIRPRGKSAFAPLCRGFTFD